MRAVVVAVLLLGARPSGAEGPLDPPRDARARIADAFRAGTPGPDPASIPEPSDPSERVRALETRALARGLLELRAGTTFDRVAAFSALLDPVGKPMPERAALEFYLRPRAPAGGGAPERAASARARARVDAALKLGAAALAVTAAVPEAAEPASAVPELPRAPAVRRPERVLAAAPPFASAERGAVVPPVNRAARTELASIDARLEGYDAARAEAWSAGRPFAAAGLAAVGAAGRVIRASWSLVAGATGKDSAENIARAALYVPAAALDYRERQAALPPLAAAPARFVSGTMLNMTVFGVETLPGTRLTSDALKAAYRGLARESRDALHRIQAEAEALAEARAKAASAPDGALRAAHEAEVETARLRFEKTRAELDATRARMIETHMAYALEHEFHGRVDARLLDRAELDALNARFVREGGSPPFHAGVPLYEVAATKPLELCRTHRAPDLRALRAAGKANGDWFIPCEMASHLDQKHLRDLLALPDTNATDYVARFTVPAGTKFYVGAAGPIRGESSTRVARMYTDAEGRAVGGGGNGGKLQFFLDAGLNAPRARDGIRYLRSEPVPGSDPALLRVLESFRRAADAGDREAARQAYRSFDRRRRELAERIGSDDGLRLDYERVDAHLRERFPNAFGT